MRSLRFGALALGLAAAATTSLAQEPPPPGVKYKPGSGFTLYDGEDFTLQVTGRVQARYTYTDYDSDRTNKTNESSFTAERVRIGVKGTLFKVWKYQVEEDFGKGKAELKKAYLAWATCLTIASPSPVPPAVRLRALSTR